MAQPRRRPPPPVTMTATEVTAARATLGAMWGKGEPLSKRELAAVLRVSPDRINHIEAGRIKATPLFCVAMKLMLAGAHPPDMLKILRL